MPPSKSFTSKRAISEQLADARSANTSTRRLLRLDQLDLALAAARLAAEAAEEVVTRIEERIADEHLAAEQ